MQNSIRANEQLQALPPAAVTILSEQILSLERLSRNCHYFDYSNENVVRTELMGPTGTNRIATDVDAFGVIP